MFQTIVVMVFSGLSLSCSDFGEPLEPSPSCGVSARTLSFGTVAPGDSTTRRLEIRNPGRANLTGEVQAACPGFDVVTGGGAFELEPGERLEILVQFAPADIGFHSCLLELGSICGSVSLSGVGRDQTPGGQCSLESESIDFGGVPVGQSADRAMRLINTGSVDLIVDIASPCPEIEVVSGAGFTILGAGDTLVAVLRFIPSSAGMFQCEIATGPDCANITVTGTGTSVATVSFSSDIQPVFNNNCVTCHGSNGNAGLDLRALSSHGNLVSVLSTGYQPAVRVKPFDLDGSVLYGKVTNSGQYGQQMPPPGALPQSEKDRLRVWILEGAPDN
jgi:hypothetical protein